MFCYYFLVVSTEMNLFNTKHIFQLLHFATFWQNVATEKFVLCLMSSFL